jgi:hypothetical protein
VVEAISFWRLQAQDQKKEVMLSLERFALVNTADIPSIPCFVLSSFHKNTSKSDTSFYRSFADYFRLSVPDRNFSSVYAGFGYE